MGWRGIVTFCVPLALWAPAEAAAGGGDATAEILTLERRALDGMARGDFTAGLELCAPDLSYLHPALPVRVDDKATLARLFAPRQGQRLFERYEVVDPLVQQVGGTAVLSYLLAAQLDSAGHARSETWNASVVYRRQDVAWRIVSCHWSPVKGQGPAPEAKADLERRWQLSPALTAPPPDATPIAEDDTVAAAVVARERGCLVRWGRGDPLGFVEAATPQITYFEPGADRRVDGRAAFTALMESIRGQVNQDWHRFLNPRVQVCDDVAVLTFNYVSRSTRQSGPFLSWWNCTEVYLRIRSEDGSERWDILHSHWSQTCSRF